MVENINRAMVIGRDFLGTHKAGVLYNKGELHLGKGYVKLENDIEAASVIRASETIVLRHQTINIIQARV